eukprot:11866647-Alexandrium_andersonii.AAC.1
MVSRARRPCWCSRRAGCTCPREMRTVSMTIGAECATCRGAGRCPDSAGCARPPLQSDQGVGHATAMAWEGPGQLVQSRRRTGA